MSAVPFLRRSDIIILGSGLAAMLLTALSLLLFWDGMPTSGLPLISDATLPVIPTGRSRDPLIAAFWIMILVRYSLDHRRDAVTALLPVVGFLTGVGAYLLLRDKVEIFSISLMPITGLVTGRVMNLFDDAEHRKQGGQADTFDAGAAFHACAVFGLGMLVPFAVRHGFLITTVIPLMSYLLVSFLLSGVVFGTLGVLRLTATIHRRVMPDS